MNIEAQVSQYLKLMEALLITSGQTAKAAHALCLTLATIAKERKDGIEQLGDFLQGGIDLAKKHPGEKIDILTYDIEPEYAKQLFEICERRGITLLQTNETKTDNYVDGNDLFTGTQNSIIFFSPQKKELEMALGEAKLRSGFIKEMSMDVLNVYIQNEKDLIQKTKNELEKIELSLNPDKGKIKLLEQKLQDLQNNKLDIKMLSGIPVAEYEILKNRKNLLPKNQQFTFAKTAAYELDGEMVVDVAFCSKTYPLYDKIGNREIDQSNISRYDNEYRVRDMLVNLNVMKTVHPEMLDNLTKDIEFRDKISKELVKTQAITKTTIINEIDNLKVSEPFLLKNEISKDILDINTIKAIVDRDEKLNKSQKENLLKDINSLGKEKYIVPIKIIEKDNKQKSLTIDLDKFACVGDDLTIRQPGRDDIVITDKKAIESNIKQFVSEISDDLNTKFVVLNADEMLALKMGDPKRKRTKNIVVERNIEFIEQNKDEYKRFKEEFGIKDDFDRIEQLNQRKERFLASSDVKIDYETKLRENNNIKGMDVANLINKVDEIESKETSAKAVIESESQNNPEYEDYDIVIEDAIYTNVKSYSITKLNENSSFERECQEAKREVEQFNREHREDRNNRDTRQNETDLTGLDDLYNDDSRLD